MGSDRPGWKRVRRGEEHDYTVLKIREDQVEDPRTARRYPRVVIECTDWVNVIPVTREGQIVLVRQFRFGIWRDTLEIPGGMIDPGEAPEHAAARELEEETGYRAQRLVPLGSIHPNPAVQTNRCHSFLALDCEQVHDGRPDESEDIQVVLAAREQIPELILNGEISHALVAVAFLLEQYRTGR